MSVYPVRPPGGRPCPLCPHRGNAPESGRVWRCNRPVWIGYDANGSSGNGDSGAVSVVVPPAVPGGRFRTVETRRVQGLEFEEQARVIEEFTRRYNVEHIGIDVTGGNGEAVYQIVKRFFPAAIPYTFTLSLAAADAGCFATYIEKQGGVLVPRKDYLIRTAYDLADELNDYGEQSVQIYGIWSPLIGESSRVCTHPDNWKLVRRKPETEDSARENGFDLQGGPAAPWTRGNNCPRVQETDNNGTEQPEERSAPWPQLPDGIEVNEWMRSLKRHERRALMRSLRDKQAKNSSDEMQSWTQSRKQPRPLPDNHELLAREWRESAESLGLHIGEQQMQHLLRGGSLYVDGSIIAPQGFEIVRKPDAGCSNRVIHCA